MSKKYIIKKKHLASPLGEELAVMDTEDGLYYSLNESGKLIWQTLTKETSEEELVSKLTANFEVSKEEANKDVKTLISSLIEYGIVESVSS